jgi:hypothetical protein
MTPKTAKATKPVRPPLRFGANDRNVKVPDLGLEGTTETNYSTSMEKNMKTRPEMLQRGKRGLCSKDFEDMETALENLNKMNHKA